MSAPASPPAGFQALARQHLQDAAIDLDEQLDVAKRRFNARFGFGQPRHIAAYRGFADDRGVELIGRLLNDAPETGPREADPWWDNLLDTYRRFASDEVPDEALKVRFRGVEVDVRTDHEGYYRASLDTHVTPSDCPWDNAMVSLADGTLATPQPVLQVAPTAGFGIISDIDDTVLHSSIVDWKTAAQLTFLHNARTRKPLDGVAALYTALQRGADGTGRHPIFYVSSSPWNLYDLLEDFMELNAIPCGPIFLRDLGLEPGQFIKSEGHGHKPTPSCMRKRRGRSPTGSRRSTSATSTPPWTARWTPAWTATSKAWPARPCRCCGHATVVPSQNTPRSGA